MKFKRQIIIALIQTQWLTTILLPNKNQRTAKIIHQLRDQTFKEQTKESQLQLKR